jgi:hypothetical protein
LVHDVHGDGRARGVVAFVPFRPPSPALDRNRPLQRVRL